MHTLKLCQQPMVPTGFEVRNSIVPVDLDHSTLGQFSYLYIVYSDEIFFHTPLHRDGIKNELGIKNIFPWFHKNLKFIFIALGE